ncbi:MAG: imidazole glycerol phosphate synthase subunit HisF [Deltaproteobacteria bacterium RIFCSPLOWO2_02_FULL_44_10]|nr:MAG: imidazole glycerol phosphate synthase subunit HisF [Deltaproteobacteria bacterium RIFCSPHIGHO2_02_FULL_44_16]OGQ45088.1 MAG: imidazole glycerol phosphate synthase subunit HisF [Deltaproteobacteria bacterium RIFCSPLOWO2_02_FULL_44_10]
MPIVRIIPKLEIKGPNLVKGIHLEGLRVLGKPEHFARYYYEQGADELVYQDVVASLYGRNSLLEMIRKTSQEIFIPLTVGGGLRSLEDIREVLRAGADKVALNTAVLREPKLIQKASQMFGSSTILVSIEAIKKHDGSYEAYTDCGREETGINAIEWAKEVETLGAGEIMLTSIDGEGTGRGYDLELTKTIAQSVSIPVIACGGAGNFHHIRSVIKEGFADAVCLASMLHYNFIKHAQSHKENYSVEGNTKYLNASTPFTLVEETTLSEIKRHLEECGVHCRFQENSHF